MASMLDAITKECEGMSVDDICHMARELLNTLENDSNACKNSRWRADALDALDAAADEAANPILTSIRRRFGYPPSYTPEDWARHALVEARVWELEAVRTQP